MIIRPPDPMKEIGLWARWDDLPGAEEYRPVAWTAWRLLVGDGPVPPPGVAAAWIDGVVFSRSAFDDLDPYSDRRTCMVLNQFARIYLAKLEADA